MRTTVDLDDDTAKAVEQLRRDRGIGTSEAVNHLIRQGLLPRDAGRPFAQKTAKLGIRVDVSNVAQALEDLDGIEAR
ncbi:ribbon-helix-helix protein, CopG family [Mycobacterium sp. Lab-001]|uniref:ribbon-helix-helix protein, CopG family n=1 Tax=Mycobacterium sp. Lab-001 TaxID=3410136 RepID=UPI003D17D31B